MDMSILKLQTVCINDKYGRCIERDTIPILTYIIMYVDMLVERRI